MYVYVCIIRERARAFNVFKRKEKLVSPHVTYSYLQNGKEKEQHFSTTILPKSPENPANFCIFDALNLTQTLI